MSVLIQINGENAAEAIQELSDLASGITGKSAAAPADTPKQTRSRNAAKPEKETPANKPEPEPERESPAADPEPEEQEESAAADSDEPIPTDVELRAVAAEVGKKGPEAKKAIKALLDKYGVPNITAVPDDKRIAFKAELEAL